MSNLSSSTYQQLFELHAELLKALAHPRRLEILQLLRHQPMNVSMMQEMLDLPQANISQHLQVLREAGVVTPARNGKEITYSIAHPNFITASDLLREVLVQRHSQDDLGKALSTDMLELVPVVTDPVCHMRVSPKTAGFAHPYEGETYYFCASGCYQQFQKEPERYV